jgi:hypothetical protein
MGVWPQYQYKASCLQGLTVQGLQRGATLQGLKRSATDATAAAVMSPPLLVLLLLQAPA